MRSALPYRLPTQISLYGERHDMMRRHHHPFEFQDRSKIAPKTISSKNEPRYAMTYFINDKTCREKIKFFFITDPRSSYRARLIFFILKIISCILYVVRVLLDSNENSEHWYGLFVGNKTRSEDEEINWKAMVWVGRPVYIWIPQVILAIVYIAEYFLYYIASPGVHFCSYSCSFYALFILLGSVPFLVTLVWIPWRKLFVPSYINCWLARRTLKTLFYDLHRIQQRRVKRLNQKVIILALTISCFIFSSACGIEHLQRVSLDVDFSLFKCWFIMTETIGTVGSTAPVDDWPVQAYVLFMIIAALAVLPRQIERLRRNWKRRQEMGFDYDERRATREMHIVVYTQTMESEKIMDFLTEFYSHPMLQHFNVVLLCPRALDPELRKTLEGPIWLPRVVFVQGSCTKRVDLTRTSIEKATACFILFTRTTTDKLQDDEHTILNAWAVKDFVADIPLFTQIHQPEHMIHVNFAEQVVCEDEIKYSLLANNCLHPGVSSLITLLLHTSSGLEGHDSTEAWHRLYGKCSGNSIHRMEIQHSSLLKSYIGKNFLYASLSAFKKYEITLIGIGSNTKSLTPIVFLNPGPRHLLQPDEILYYIGQDTAVFEDVKEHNEAVSNRRLANIDSESILQYVMDFDNFSIPNSSEITTSESSFDSIIDDEEEKEKQQSTGNVEAVEKEK